MDILANIAWSFSDIGYNTAKAFNAAIVQYQQDIYKALSSWHPEKIVVDTPAVDILFSAWLANDSIADNETLLEDEGFFEDESNSDDGMFQAELMARFTADNGQNFSALEIMYKLHHQMHDKDFGYHIFFEGLSLHSNENNIPMYYMGCGS